MSTLYYKHAAQVPDEYKKYAEKRDDGTYEVSVAPKARVDNVIIRGRLKEIFDDPSYGLQPTAMNAITADVCQAYTCTEQGTIIPRDTDGSSLEQFMKNDLRAKSPIFYKERESGEIPNKEQRDAMSTDDLWMLAAQEKSQSRRIKRQGRRI